MKTLLILAFSSVIALTGCSAGGHIGVGSNDNINGGALPASSHPTQNSQDTLVASNTTVTK